MSKEKTPIDEKIDTIVGLLAFIVGLQLGEVIFKIIL